MIRKKNLTWRRVFRKRVWPSSVKILFFFKGALSPSLKRGFVGSFFGDVTLGTEGKTKARGPRSEFDLKLNSDSSTSRRESDRRNLDAWVASPANTCVVIEREILCDSAQFLAASNNVTIGSTASLRIYYLCDSACLMPQHSLYIFCWLDHTTRNHKSVCLSALAKKYELFSGGYLKVVRDLSGQKMCPDFRAVVARFPGSR